MAARWIRFGSHVYAGRRAGALGTVAAAAVAVPGFDGGGQVMTPVPAGIYRMAWDGKSGGWKPDFSNPMISLGPCGKASGHATGQGTKPEGKSAAPGGNDQ